MQGRYRMEQLAGRLWLGNTVWQGGTGQQQGSVLTLGPGPAMVEVVSVGDRDHLRLVPDQPYASPHIRSHGTFEASLSEETVDSLDLVPALGSRHFWQESGSFLAASLIIKLYSDAMSPQVPVSVVGTILEVAEDGHGHVEAGELLPAHRAEPGVLHGTSDGIFSQALVQLHFVKSSNTASEFLVFSDLPGDEEWIVLITERGDLRGLEVVKVAVQNVEAEVAHLGLDDPEAPPWRAHHGP